MLKIISLIVPRATAKWNSYSGNIDGKMKINEKLFESKQSKKVEGRE